MPKFSGLRNHAPAILISVCLAGLLLPSATALAHHSNAMFDKSQPRQVTATIREFQWTNPHIWIQVLIENGDGEQVEWSIEGGGPLHLLAVRDSTRPSFKCDVRQIPASPGDGDNQGISVDQSAHLDTSPH